jgi:Flp pilus assembly protein TadD
VALVFPALLLAGCMFDDKPLADIDRPPPRLGAAGDLDEEALQRLAQRAEAGGMDATQIYRRLAERRPSSPEARIGLARHLQQRGDLVGAETEYRQALAIAPANTDARLGLAQILYARGLLQEASAFYRTVLERDSSNLRALNGLGAVLDNGGRHEEAQAQYRRAIEIDPRDKTARNNLGLSLAMSGRPEEGIPILQALAAEPDATAAHKATLARAQALARKPGQRSRVANGG